MLPVCTAVRTSCRQPSRARAVARSEVDGVTWDQLGSRRTRSGRTPIRVTASPKPSPITPTRSADRSIDDSTRPTRRETLAPPRTPPFAAALPIRSCTTAAQRTPRRDAAQRASGRAARLGLTATTASARVTASCSAAPGSQLSSKAPRRSASWRGRHVVPGAGDPHAAAVLPRQRGAVVRRRRPARVVRDAGDHVHPGAERGQVLGRAGRVGRDAGGVGPVVDADDDHAGADERVAAGEAARCAGGRGRGRDGSARRASVAACSGLGAHQ